MVGLKKQIQDGNLKNLYLLYGEEEFLINYYIDKIKEMAVPSESELMNVEVIEKEHDNGYIVNSIKTFPFLAERRVVIVKNLDFFGAKSSVSDDLVDVVKNMPTETVLIFAEKKVDRRSKFFKAVKNSGYVVEFNHLTENDLIKWVAIELKKQGKKADQGTLIHFIRTVGSNMQFIRMEMEKLCAYKLEEEWITVDDVNAITTKTIEYQIFQLVDAMGMKKSSDAIIMFNHLIQDNEPPIRILIMLTRQIRLIYQTKVLMDEGFTVNMIGKKIGVPPFVAKKCMAQGRFFTKEILKQALEECLFVDEAIKTGQIKDKLAVEMLLNKYSKKNIAIRTS